MSSLANTSWIVDLGQDSKVTFKFNPNGTATADGGGTWYWSEFPNGNWVVQSLNDILQDNVSVIYFGQHSNGQGTGYYTNGWNGAMAELQPFSMTKN